VSGPAPTATAGVEPGDPVEPALAVPLSYAGKILGRIECGPGRDGPLLDEDRRLLGHLAAQAGPAVANLHLAAELNARLEVIRRQAGELTASRARIAHAQDAERQRIQRDLHAASSRTSSSPPRSSPSRASGCAATILGPTSRLPKCRATSPAC
jgi:GAF domain-containing protein